MTSDPADALREQAREWGRALLAGTPWTGVPDRVTLLLVEPPVRFPSTGSVTYWLTVDTAAARGLADPYGPALTSDRAVVEHPRTPGLNVTLAVMTDEALHRFLGGTTPAAIEARWQARHLEPISDRLRRGEQYALRAGLLPDDVPERVTRTLFLELVAAVRALAPLEVQPSAGLAAAGAASAAACRLACFDDAGNYPPAQHLRAEAAETRLGRRIVTWLDDLVRAVGGDDAAARRAVSAGDQVIEEARTILGELYRDRPWLRTPEAFALRAPR
ncbi:MAG: hypothetical protein M0R75_06255 [Dehalococcoidia bacterium]|nr:hypothetical protein [Dehalococcoidia bacterium]